LQMRKRPSISATASARRSVAAAAQLYLSVVIAYPNFYRASKDPF
jgi:hypothetical protein